MATKLTADQWQALGTRYANNPKQLYAVVAKLGYRYAAMALSVIQDTGLFGQISIDFLKKSAAAHGIKVDYNMLVRLEADLAQRMVEAQKRQPSSGRDWTFLQINQIHRDAYAQFGLNSDTDWILGAPGRALGNAAMDRLLPGLESNDPGSVATLYLEANFQRHLGADPAIRALMENWDTKASRVGFVDAFGKMLDNLGSAITTSPSGFGFSLMSYDASSVHLQVRPFDGRPGLISNLAAALTETQLPLASSDPATRSALYQQWQQYLAANDSVVNLILNNSTTGAAFQDNGSTISYSDIATTFGSTLGRLIGGGSLVIGTAAGSVLGAIALSVGQKLFHFSYSPNPQAPGGAALGTGSVWGNFQNNLQYLGTNAAIGSVSSYLAAEFAQSVGLSGPAGDVFSYAAGNILQYELTQITAASGVVGNTLDQAATTTLGGTLKAGVASFIGAELASLIVSPHTTAEATLASLGSALGAIGGAAIGSSVAAGIATSFWASGGAFSTATQIGALGGPVGAAIGAFVGFILGDLIGSLFGHHKPRVPGAYAETVLQIPYAQYGLGSESASNGGDLAFADQMAKAARDTLNGIIAQVTGKPVGASFVANGYSPTQTYGYNGGQIYVKLGGAQNNVSSADQAVDKGVLWALPQTKIIGGDLFLKRAIQNGQWQSVTELLGDLQIASDYEQYLKNAPVIDAAIASSWNGLSQGDKDFYSANQAFMTRAISASELPLTGGDVGFYDANRGQVDRIVAGVSVSSFAAGWITTIARASELGLDRFGRSDFFGGMAGFLGSFGVAAVESARHYEDYGLKVLADGALSIAGATKADEGTFALLPQGLSGPAGDMVFDPHFQQDRVGWRMDYAGDYADWGTNAGNGDWSGNGNDVAYSHLYGVPAAGSVADIRSDWMAARAGVTYEASVRAAQHRGQAQAWLRLMSQSSRTYMPWSGQHRRRQDAQERQRCEAEVRHKRAEQYKGKSIRLTSILSEREVA